MPKTILIPAAFPLSMQRFAYVGLSLQIGLKFFRAYSFASQIILKTLPIPLLKKRAKINGKELILLNIEIQLLFK